MSSSISKTSCKDRMKNHSFNVFMFIDWRWVGIKDEWIWLVDEVDGQRK